jgi:hypothetical protein
VPELDRERENGENRRSSDQERMMDDVLEKTIHCVPCADSPPALRRRPLQRVAQKVAEYSSRPVWHTPCGLRQSS